MNSWLIKTDEQEYSIDDLEKERTTIWDGVRNHQAKNFIKQIRKGDLVFFYHSKSRNPGIYGVCKVVSDPFPDPTQFDPKSKYFDKGSSLRNPRWFTIKIRFVRRIYVPVKVLKEKILRDNKYFMTQKRLTVFPLSEIETKMLLDNETHH